MLEQVGPQKLMEEIKAQAPQYAKLLPEIPMLLHNYLKQANVDSGPALRELWAEQRRTNNLLQGLVYALVGFALGMGVMQILVKTHFF